MWWFSDFSLLSFFDGSNIAECPSFEIKLFILTVHNLSICYIISHISVEGESSSEESDVLVRHVIHL